MVRRGKTDELIEAVSRELYMDMVSQQCERACHDNYRTSGFMSVAERRLTKTIAARQRRVGGVTAERDLLLSDERLGDVGTKESAQTQQPPPSLWNSGGL